MLRLLLGLYIKLQDSKGDVFNTARAAQSGHPEQAAVDADLHREIVALIPALRRYARALKRDVAAADDLVQDCLCRALAKIHLWQKGTDLRAWLFTILHNQHASEVRQSMRRGVSVAVDDVAPLLSIAADAVSLMQLRDLKRAIDSLSEAQRQVILLVGLEGMKYEDAAAMLGVPIGTLRSRLFRGRERLRELLAIDDTTKSSSAASRLLYMQRHASADLTQEASA